MVSAITRRGEVKFTARVTKDIMKGVMFMPFHFPGAANVLTNNALDPVAKVEEIKASAVKICKIKEA